MASVATDTEGHCPLFFGDLLAEQKQEKLEGEDIGGLRARIAELVTMNKLLEERLTKAYDNADEIRHRLQRSVGWPGEPGHVYSFAPYEDMEGCQWVIYVGTLEFDVTTVIRRDGQVMKLKPEYVKHFNVIVGYDWRINHLVALNRRENPPHPHIGRYICVPEVPFISRSIDELDAEEVQDQWNEVKKKVAADLSTINLANMFSGDSWYDDESIYEGAATTVFVNCMYRSEDCDPTRFCDICGTCGYHCDGVWCNSCGELVHDYCHDCECCTDCGCICGTIVCSTCGERVTDYCSDCDNCYGCGCTCHREEEDDDTDDDEDTSERTVWHP